MLKPVALMLLCIGIFSFSFGQGKRSKPKNEKTITVFSVGGNPVTANEFLYLYKKNHTKKEDFTQQKVEEYLELFINFKLKVQEARQRGMDTSPSFVKEYNSYKDELRKPYLPDASLTDSLVKKTYDRLKEEVKASHILITLTPDPSAADTLEAYNRIVDIRDKIFGGEDFARAASLYSEDPSARTNQGSLGYFTALQMVYPFESAAYQTKVGDVSQPVRTKFGYHLVKVFDRRAARGEVEVSHIMIRTGEERDSETAKNSIFTIYDQLQAGAKWEELCKQYSEDPATKDNGGKLRPFGTGAMAGVPEFENMAFNLEKAGDISDPFQSQYGWHIIRLEQKIPLAAFDAIAPSLKNRVLRDERTEVSKQALQIRLRKEFNLVENKDVKQVVFLHADSSLQNGNWKLPDLPDTEKMQLFSLKGRSASVKEFLDYVQVSQAANTQTPAKYLEQLYNNFIETSILQSVEEKIVQENPTYSFLLKEYYEGILLFEIMEKEVWNKASEDSVGQHAFYNNHISDYQAGERSKTVLYSSKTDEFTSPLKELIGQGDERKIQDLLKAKRVKVESGFFKKEEKAVFAKIPWSKGVYSTENEGIYYLAWLKEILPAGSMSFDEARSAVISDYQVYLEKKWLEELKKKHSVKVDEKGKKYILQQLQAK